MISRKLTKTEEVVLFVYNMADKHDQTLMGILTDEGQVIPFLDSMFGFLYRCTDFFRLQNEPGDKLGFPQGIAEQIVLKVLQKWETQARLDDENYYKLRNSSNDGIPPAVREEVVDSETSQTNEDKENESTSSLKMNQPEKNIANNPRIQGACDSYNGAVRNGYQWSQSISDLDVQVTVPTCVTKARHVKVDIDSEKLCVRLNDSCDNKEIPDIDNTPLLEGDLCYKTRKEESTWTLIPGKEIHIHLEKCQERWWDSLITTEEKINLENIDASRPVDDLPQEEQMKIQELMWSEQRKKAGLLDPQHQMFENHDLKNGIVRVLNSLAAELYEDRIKKLLLWYEKCVEPVADMLKKAWNQEGSPFKGMEYNPSMINFEGNFMPNQDLPS